jgi:hypothetical protein
VLSANTLLSWRGKETEEEWEGAWVFGDKGPDFCHNTTGLYISGGTLKYIKLRPSFSCLILVLIFKIVKEDQALKSRVDTWLNPTPSLGRPMATRLGICEGEYNRR